MNARQQFILGSEMDAEQHLAFVSEISVGVLGKAGEFILVPLNEPAPIDEALTVDATARGFEWCGVLGILDGQPMARVAWENPGASYTMLFAGLAFAKAQAERLLPQAESDWVRFAENLYGPKDA